jgi:hypothetical protein
VVTALEFRFDDYEGWAIIGTGVARPSCAPSERLPHVPPRLSPQEGLRRADERKRDAGQRISERAGYQTDRVLLGALRLPEVEAD